MLELVSERHGPRPLAATLHWHSDDPFAVILTMATSRTTVREWEFAVDLLACAFGNVGEAVGIGDVAVQVDSEDQLWIRLSSPSGFAVLACNASVPREFVVAVESRLDDRADTVDVQLDWFLQEVDMEDGDTYP